MVIAHRFRLATSGAVSALASGCLCAGVPIAKSHVVFSHELADLAGVERLSSRLG